MAKLYLPTILRNHAEGNTQLELTGSTVSDILSAFTAKYPATESRIRDANGRVHRYINIFVNGKDIRTLDGEQTAVGDQDEVHLIPAMAGGSC